MNQARARDERHVLILGAGASRARPAGLPVFRAMRKAMLEPLHIEICDQALEALAPEVLLSRLDRAGIDVDAELRQMLVGGHPNVIHHLAVANLARSGAVWTTNFDELIESAASSLGVAFHRILPGEEIDCGCGRGHLIKIHGTLSGRPLMARAEDVLLPLGGAWLERLAGDCAGATVTVVGYAGADVDLRSGLRIALEGATEAQWFTGSDVETEIRRRFAGPVDSGVLEVRSSERPDLVALARPELAELVADIDPALIEAAEQPANSAEPKAGYRPNDLSRATLLDTVGQIEPARRLFAKATRHGPHRLRAARSLYSTGLIHGARWRPAVVGALDLASRLPVRWGRPHLDRLPYLTWNLTPAERLPKIERSLELLGDDPRLLLAAANAAKEVDPRRAVELGTRARDAALTRERPAAAAWATLVISLALRSLGDLDQAAKMASNLGDGYGTLGGPNWVAWGAYECAAIAALRSELPEAQGQIQISREIFDASGSTFAVDAACAEAAIERVRGERQRAETALARARAALSNEGSLRADFKQELLDFEVAELRREDGRLEEAGTLYAKLARSPNLAQEILGLLGLGEVQARQGSTPEASWRALRRSEQADFGYGRVHAAVTLGLSGEIEEPDAEELIAASRLRSPTREDVDGLRRYCQGPDPVPHLLCFPC
jgi:hypothetical protein